MATAPVPRSHDSEVLEADADVAAHALLGDLALGDAHVEQIGGRNVDVLAQALDLVGPRAEHRVEDPRVATGTRSGCATHVPSWPSPASRSLSARTLVERGLVDLGVVAGSGLNAAMPPIAWAPRRWHVLTSSSRVGAHEGDRHGHLRAVGEHELAPVCPELLDDAEDVVPAARS